MARIPKVSFFAAVAVLAAAFGVAQKQTPPSTPRNTSPSAEQKQLSDSFKGSELYKAYCATCHGKDGKGVGPMAGALKTAPSDLTRIAARNGGTFPFVKVQKIIAGEEQPAGSHGSREMPVWGPIFSEVSWDQDLGRVRVYSLAMYLEEMQSK